MKKRYIMLGILFFSLICVMIVFTTMRARRIATFDLRDYEYYLECFPSSEVVAPITDQEVAVREAIRIWENKYPLNYEEYDVWYDRRNSCWLICAKLPDNVLGGGPCAIIQSDGAVLAVWHYM